MQRYQPIYLTVSPVMKQAITKAAKKMAVSVNHLVNEVLVYHFQGMVDSDETDTGCTNYQRIVARLKLNAAIRSGKIKRQPCEVCGAEPAEGHHPDYSRPLDVVFLCPQHHRELHQAERMVEGSQDRTGWLFPEMVS